MCYDNSIIQGDIISIESMCIERAKKIALSTHPYAKLNQIIRKQDGSEALIFTLDIDINQKPLNGIKATEEIAVICEKQDIAFPAAFALRKSFKLGLPHTNAKEFERPVSLCLTEQIFSEVKHSFNSFEFIESIRIWFAKASRNELHAEDQPLEPFIHYSGYVLLTTNIDLDNFCLKEISPDIKLYAVQNLPSVDTVYFCRTIFADKQVHGFIRRQPKTIKDLSEFVFINGKCLSEVLMDYFEGCKKLSEIDRAYLTKKLAIYCRIPTCRYQIGEKPETAEEFFFITDLTLQEIGLKAGVWDISCGELVYLLNKDFDLEYINSISVKVLSIVYDFNKLAASFYNKSIANDDLYTMIGVGALGSQVINLFARTGFGRWNLIDHDILLPHNLARHYLNREYVGSNKAISLSKEMNYLLNSDFAIPANYNFFDLPKREQIFNILNGSKYIIDISTSIGVARSLARDFDEKIKAPRISAFLNPSGTELVVLGEDKHRKRRLDLLEMQFYRMLFEDSRLHSHYREEDTKIRYATNSCRDITSRINQVDISVLSSICTKAIRACIEGGKAIISIWGMDINSFEVKRIDAKISSWVRKSVGNWKIYIDIWLIEKMQLARKAKLPKETGGILIGSIDTERGIIYILDTILGPEDSIETPISYIRGKEGLVEEYNKYKKITGNQILYLGEWHSHPQKYSTNPSKEDLELFDYIYNQLHRQGYPTIMGILGDNDYLINIRD